MTTPRESLRTALARRVVPRPPGSPSGRPVGAARAASWLPVIATVALLGFSYAARVDVIGVFSPARGWAAMTLRPVPPVWHFAVAGLLLGVLPVVAARRLTGLSLADLGLGFGRVRSGLVWLAVGIPLAILAGKISASSAVMRAVYPLDPSVTLQVERFVPYAAAQFLYFGSWEVLFRGVLLFGLRRPLGAGGANGLQTALSVTAHFGRALNETVAALAAGPVFGWVDLRLGSVWYVAVIHWTVGVSQDWFVLHR